MLRRLKAGMRRALGLHYLGRNLVVYPDDTFIVSYPKSGNTWTRFLVANLLHPETPADFGNINDLIPDPEALTKRKIDAMPRPRMVKSHQYFDPRFPKVVYIVRDPRDVAVSQYHFHRKRRVIEDDFSIQLFVTRFIAGGAGIYGSWGENVASWLATRYGSQNFLLLRYEDLMTATLDELAKLASFLGTSTDPALLSQAVARSSADEMRRLEKTQARLWSSIRDTRPDVPFVRSAKAGGWKSELPEVSVVELEVAWGSLMSWLGYQPVSSPSSPLDGERFSASVLGGRSLDLRR